MTFRPNFGHFQANGKNVTMNIYMRVRNVKYLDVYLDNKNSTKRRNNQRLIKN